MAVWCYIKNMNAFLICISLDMCMCVFLSEIATINHLQHICHVHCLPALIRLCFLSEWSPYTFINMLAYNHTIKLINTSAARAFLP